MKILILSKTKMHTPGKCCIGGVSAEGEFVRLLTQTGDHQACNTDLVVGSVWEVEYSKPQQTEPPHVEDILVSGKRFVKQLGDGREIIEVIKKLDAPIWTGTPNSLFDGKIRWTGNGSGYISHHDIPSQSVGFWIPDIELQRHTSDEKTKYENEFSDGRRRLTYVGYVDPVDVIPAGTLLRVSLARWWSPSEDFEDRCYLQLSGWYHL
jgi:hypothetical protein